jgi:lipase
VTFLRAPRGLRDEPGGRYSQQDVECWQSRYPDVVFETVAGVNHYTITLGETGAAAVSAAIAAQLNSVQT